MTKRETLRIAHQEAVLESLGFTPGQAVALRRISMTLHRWHERECGIDGGCIERDETTDRPYWRSSYSGRRTPIADREKGAIARFKAIVATRNARVTDLDSSDVSLNIHASCRARTCGHNVLSYYIQTDPRGCALYILRPGDVPDGADAGSYYSRGIAIY